LTDSFKGRRGSSSKMHAMLLLRHRLTPAGLILALACSCSPSEDGSPDVAGQCAEPPCMSAQAGDGALELSVQTGEFTVPSGEDFFQCFHTSYIAEQELAVIGARGTQATGGHHITVYYTLNVEEPHSKPCDDSEMVEWNQIGAAGSETFDLDFPEGLGVRVPAGSQVVLQSHYINTTLEPITARDEATILLARPDELEGFLNDYVVLDTGFSVPPLKQTESVTTCRTPQDVEILRLLGHEHEWGTYFKLEEIDETGTTKRVLHETDWLPEYTSNPPMHRYPREEPLMLIEGTRLRQTCRWNNTEAYALEFPREMCLTYALYYPDAGGRVFCVPE
jgi:hypothetical protein